TTLDTEFWQNYLQPSQLEKRCAINDIFSKLAGLDNDDFAATHFSPTQVCRTQKKISSELSQQLRDKAQSLNISLNNLMQMAWLRCLNHISEAAIVCVGVT